MTHIWLGSSAKGIIASANGLLQPQSRAEREMPGQKNKSIKDAIKLGSHKIKIIWGHQHTTDCGLTFPYSFKLVAHLRQPEPDDERRRATLRASATGR